MIPSASPRSPALCETDSNNATRPGSKPSPEHSPWPPARATSEAAKELAQATARMRDQRRCHAKQAALRRHAGESRALATARSRTK
eukprot:11113959-Karenia_brevis.AAC.1